MDPGVRESTTRRAIWNTVFSRDRWHNTCVAEAGNRKFVAERSVNQRMEIGITAYGKYGRNPDIRGAATLPLNAEWVSDLKLAESIVSPRTGRKNEGFVNKRHVLIFGFGGSFWDDDWWRREGRQEGQRRKAVGALTMVVDGLDSSGFLNQSQSLMMSRDWKT